jgi:plastocyanin
MPKAASTSIISIAEYSNPDDAKPGAEITSTTYRYLGNSKRCRSRSHGRRSNRLHHDWRCIPQGGEISRQGRGIKDVLAKSLPSKPGKGPTARMRVGLLDEESTAPSFKEITMVISKTMRSALVAAALGAATGVVLAVVVLPVRAQDAAALTVSIHNFTFMPQTLPVKAGTTVTWNNKDDTVHGIASDNHAFRSKALDTDDIFAFTFTTPGTYKYFCYLHSYMKGTIVVQPNGG